MLDGGSMFGNAPRAVWERWIQPDEIGRIPLACRSMLVKIGDQLILCETGIGAFFAPKMAERYGVQNGDRHLLLEELNELGFKEEDIDLVILSHLHFDHAGGLLSPYSSGEKRLLFPNAHYVVGEEAWERAQNPHSRDRASFVPEINQALEASGRLEIIKRDGRSNRVPPQIEFFWSDGHTPGQMHCIVKGDQNTILFAGDLIPGSQWVHLPITMGYDRYPELLIDEKKKLYENIESQKWFVFYTHDNDIACSQITKNEKGKFQAVSQHAQLREFQI